MSFPSLPGYGNINYKREGLLAHRLMYVLVTGKYPLGYDIHHICSNKWCVSPYHLEAITRSQHLTITKRSTYCKNGHERSLENTLIRRGGKYDCKICHRLRARKYRKSKRA